MDISKWFYRPHYTTPELDKKIEDVEKALGFKLFIWQKTYIEYGVFRQYGETTAKILRLLCISPFYLCRLRWSELRRHLTLLSLLKVLF